jgi:hypothetical protein
MQDEWTQHYLSERGTRGHYPESGVRTQGHLPRVGRVSTVPPTHPMNDDTGSSNRREKAQYHPTRRGEKMGRGNCETQGQLNRTGKLWDIRPLTKDLAGSLTTACRARTLRPRTVDMFTDNGKKLGNLLKNHQPGIICQGRGHRFSPVGYCTYVRIYTWRTQKHGPRE